MSATHDPSAHMRIDGVVGRLGNLEGRFDGLERRQESNSLKLDGLAEQSADINAKLDLIVAPLKDSVGEVGDKLHDIGQRLTVVEQIRHAAEEGVKAGFEFRKQKLVAWGGVVTACLAGFFALIQFILDKIL